MTPEEKELLLKDLCARLPYGVKCCARYNTGNRYNTNITAVAVDRDYIEIRQNVLHSYTGSSVEDIRPYLRPMSSMTEEEKYEYLKIIDGFLNFENAPRVVDWLNAHHFDYRTDPITGKSMIDMGLALEAPKDMYKTE